MAIRFLSIFCDHKKVVLRLAVAAAALIGGVTQAKAEGRYALVVGVERYDPAELAPLEWAEDDAESVGAAQRRCL